MPAVPRILYLHGGGSNADVMRVQSRAFLAALAASDQPLFRFVFVEAPFLSPPHPAIVAVYGDMGPFRRWVRYLPDHAFVDPSTVASETIYAIRSAMEMDDAELGPDPGARGEWVGIMGFSQGATVAASVLLAQQRAAESGAEMPLGVRLRFGVVMGGRAPTLNLNYDLPVLPHIRDAGQIAADFDDWPAAGANAEAATPPPPHVLRDVPTFHVHATRDPGLDLHRRMLDDYCAKGTTRLVVWEGGHRVPIRKEDVEAVAGGFIATARDAGIDV